MSEKIMLKHHKLISLAIGLVFLIALQKFASPIPVFRFLLPAFLLFVIVVTLYNRWYLKQIGKYNFWVLVRPILLFAGGFGIFLTIPSPGLRGMFMAVTVLFITFVELFLGNTAENLRINETLIIIFGIFFALFAGYYYVPSFEPLYLIGIFLGSSLAARAFYEPTPQPQKTKLVGAITLGLFSGELYWVMNFLHFHYSVLALLLFDIFYFCLILNYFHLYHLLNFKKVQFHIFLIIVSAVVVLLSTPWVIIS